MTDLSSPTRFPFPANRTKLDVGGCELPTAGSTPTNAFESLEATSKLIAARQLPAASIIVNGTTLPAAPGFKPVML